MGEVNFYKCKKCGWETIASPGGADILMDGSGDASYICPDCKEVFNISFSSEEPYITPSREVCPKCGCDKVFAWKPEDFCPNCGGEMEFSGGYCLND
jgi:DNA-directed RNA polymerase subunit RPC12/RpoP